MQLLADYINALNIGKESVFENLAVFPLMNEAAASVAGYQLLGEAIGAGTVKITEISEGGSVPELLLDNAGDLPVFILDGEELVGAKQNRVANVSILAAPRARTPIPVSCVEAGRWGYDSREFRTSDHAHFAKGRAAKAASVSASMRTHGARSSDQREVWANISGKAAAMEARSATEAMSDVYATYSSALEDMVAAAPAQAHQVGAAFAINGRLAGVEGFDSTETCGKLFAKIVRSYALDAIEERGRDAAPEPVGERAVEQFLASVAAGTCEAYEGVGLGRDIRITGPQVIGGALALEDRLLHVACFSEAPRRGHANAPGVTDLRIASARRRRRMARGEE